MSTTSPQAHDPSFYPERLITGRLQTTRLPIIRPCPCPAHARSEMGGSFFVPLLLCTTSSYHAASTSQWLNGSQHGFYCEIEPTVGSQLHCALAPVAEVMMDMVAHGGQLLPLHEYKEQGARQYLQRLGAYRSFALLRAHQVQSFANAPPSAPGPARALHQQRAQPACDESAMGTLMEAIALRQPRSPCCRAHGNPACQDGHCVSCDRLSRRPGKHQSRICPRHGAPSAIFGSLARVSPPATDSQTLEPNPSPRLSHSGLR